MYVGGNLGPTVFASELLVSEAPYPERYNISVQIEPPFIIANV